MKFLALGKRIHHFRTKKKWSLEELSSRSKIEVQTLEAYEKERETPKIADLIKISKALEINVADIFREKLADKAFEVVRASDQSLSVGVVQGPLAHQGKAGYSYQPLLLSSDSRHLGAYLLELPPHQKKEDCEDLTHPGEEFLYVLQGKISVNVDQEGVELGVGDAIYLRSTFPHRISNPFSEKALVLDVIYPY